jgi:hypothetical protein
VTTGIHVIQNSYTSDSISSLDTSSVTHERRITIQTIVIQWNSWDFQGVIRLRRFGCWRHRHYFKQCHNIKFSGTIASASKRWFLCTKCAETHLRPFTIQKIFPRGYIRDPRLKRARPVGKWMEGKEGERRRNENPLSKCGYATVPLVTQ